MPGGGYGIWSGTSMAAPLAAGVAALVLSRNPDWRPVDVTKRLTDRSGLLFEIADLAESAHMHAGSRLPGPHETATVAISFESLRSHG